MFGFSFTIDSLYQPYDNSVGPWDWTLAIAQYVNTSATQTLQHCSGNNPPYPPYGYMNTGMLQYSWEQEANNYSEFTISWGEQMLSGDLKYVVDTACPEGTDRACCTPFFQAQGGCQAAEAQVWNFGSLRFHSHRLV